MKVVKIVLVAFFAISLCSFALSSKQQNVKKLYKEFLAKFDDKTALSTFALSAEPYEMKMIDLLEEDEEKSIKSKKVPPKEDRYLGKTYEVFIPEISQSMMTRLGPNRYEAEALVAQSSKFSAVIYSRSRRVGRSKSFLVATYNSRGQAIDTKYIGSCSGDRYMEIAINKGLQMMVQKNDMVDNEIQVLEIREVIFSKKGEIVISTVNKEKPTEAPKPSVEDV